MESIKEQAKFKDNAQDIFKTEIDTVENMQVIWKWKYLIIAGTVLFVLAALVFSMTIPKTYEISLILKPETSKIKVSIMPNFLVSTLDSDLNFFALRNLLDKNRLSSSKDMKTLIDNELKFTVLNRLDDKHGKIFSNKYKIAVKTDVNSLVIVMISPDKELGVESLNYLLKLLSEKYKQILKELQDNYQHKLMSTNKQLEFSIDEKEFITSKLIDIQKELDRYHGAANNLIGSDESQYKSQSILFYYSSIVDNIANLKRNKARAEWKIDFYKNEIINIKKEKIEGQAFQVIQPPTASQHPIRPKTKLYALISGAAGLFFFIFLAFFIEYIKIVLKRKT